MKKILVFGFQIFCSDITSEVGFWPLWIKLPGFGLF